MSAEALTGPESIEIHFCRRCGISIPQIDIDAQRARAVPGGFICDTCLLDAPAAAAPPAPAPVAVSRSVSQGLVLVALLYVVGATTFLLARELTREAPRPVTQTGLTASDLEPLARKVEAIDEQTRAAFAELRGNDERQREDLKALSMPLNALAHDFPRSEHEVRGRLDDLEASVGALAVRTGLTRDEVLAVIGEALRGRERGATPPPPSDPVAEGPPKAERSAEDAERDRLVAEYTAKLADKKASNQVRYNAAVQLGDLRHPAAIPSLIDALENDSYDLVCRAAAWSLGMYGRDAIPAIPALIRQLGGKDGYVGYMCERALGEITKAATGTSTTFGFDPTMGQKQRRKVQKDWEEWWELKKAELAPGAG
jgi:hypothetical protein